MTTSIQDRLRTMIDARNQGRGLPSVTNGSNLFEEGYLDSLGLFEILVQIEKEFKVELKDDDLSKENFSSIVNLSKLIETKSLS